MATAKKIAADVSRRETTRGRHSKTARNSAFRCDDLDELTLTSKLVPTGCNTTKPSVEMDTASTAPPSSAGNSPDLACLPTDGEAWPSLPECGGDGWDFLSTTEDTELWQDLPEPAVPLEANLLEEDDACSETGASSWWLIPESTSEEPADAEVAAKTTYAAAVKEQHSDAERQALWEQAMLGMGLRQQEAASRVVQAPCSRRRHKSKEASANDTSEIEPLEVRDLQTHGWKNEHKASWNTKLQRKVAAQKARRMAQRNESRKQLEEDESPASE